jgi:hypothetical protein
MRFGGGTTSGSSAVAAMSPNGNEPKAKESMAETRGRSVSSGGSTAQAGRAALPATWRLR